MSHHAPNPLFGISGLRALACLLVVFYHLNQQRSIANLAPRNWALYQFAETMSVVVSFFFILTAAGISLKFWPAILAKTEVPSAWKLFQERTLRIVPAYWTVLTVTFLIVLALQGSSVEAWWRFTSGIAFLSWLRPDTFFPVDLNGPLWYISFDMMGAMLTFATMSILSKLKRLWIPLYLVAIAWVLILWHVGFTGMSPFADVSGIMSVWFPNHNPFTFGFHFLVGILVGYVICIWHGDKRRHWRWDFVWVVLVSTLSVFLWEIRDMDDYAYSLWGMPFRFPIATLLIAGIIAILPTTRFLSHFFEARPFQFVARISYSTYLWHALILVLLGKCFFADMGNLLPSDWWTLTSLTLIITGIIAWWSHRLLEVCIPKWLIGKRFGSSKQ